MFSYKCSNSIAEFLTKEACNDVLGQIISQRRAEHPLHSAAAEASQNTTDSQPGTLTVSAEAELLIRVRTNNGYGYGALRSWGPLVTWLRAWIQGSQFQREEPPVHLAPYFLNRTNPPGCRMMAGPIVGLPTTYCMCFFRSWKGRKEYSTVIQGDLILSYQIPSRSRS